MLESLGVSLDNDVQIQEALDIMMNAANNTKMFVNNGFSPYELIKMIGGDLKILMILFQSLALNLKSD